MTRPQMVWRNTCTINIAQLTQMKNNLFTLALSVFILSGTLAHNAVAQNNDNLVAMNDEKAKTPNGARTAAGSTFIEISWDRISKDAIINFSENLVGRKFHLIDQNDEIFLSKKIYSLGMGIDLEALEPGNYYIVCKPKNSPAITSMFVVE